MIERWNRVSIGVLTGVVAGALFLSPAGAADSDPKADFHRAADLMEAGKFAEAVPLLDRVLAAYPDDPSVLWNTGIATAEVGEQSRALDAWKRYQLAVPDDWRARAKLIQSYQALGRLEERDNARRDLFEYWKAVLSKAKEEPPYYCREQFRAGGRKVLVLEYFDPVGPRRMFYRFSVVGPSGQEDYFMSLGSYDDTTEIARELGAISKNQRAYHIDKYDRDQHETFAHFNEQPTYESVRAIVVDVLVGKRSPISGSRRGSQ